MSNSNGLPYRSYPSSQAWRRVENREVILFLTACTKDRRAILASDLMHDLLVASWEKADAWRVGRYVVLPDHVHLFASPNGFDTVPVRQWVSYWKSVVTRHLPEEHSGSIWQRDLWDRQLRSGDSYAVKWEYVRSNPVRHELVEKAEDWLYQGELHQLPWHD